MLRQHFQSVPAISKYYYKDSRNDTIKGFDAVHVVGQPDNWELWLGEVKFYDDMSSAVADVIEELKVHMDRDYLRSEFTAITNKLDDSWGEASKLRQLLNQNTSLDVIFKEVCIPVLLTYESKVVQRHTSVCDEYAAEFEKEILHYQNLFAEKELPKNVIVRLFLLPLESKKKLVGQMDEALKKCQAAF